MSTREKFEAWCDLTERDPTDRDLYAAWEESRAEALEEAARLIDEELENARHERLYPGLVGTLEECADAIRALAKDGGEAT